MDYIPNVNPGQGLVSNWDLQQGTQNNYIWFWTYRQDQCPRNTTSSLTTSLRELDHQAETHQHSPNGNSYKRPRPEMSRALFPQKESVWSLTHLYLQENIMGKA